MAITTQTYKLNINAAAEALKSVALKTPLQYHRKLSEKFQAEVYLKREDLQVVRSYKIRGTYNLIQSLAEEQRKRGVVCASAGNHAQGVAFQGVLWGWADINLVHLAGEEADFGLFLNGTVIDLSSSLLEAE